MRGRHGLATAREDAVAIELPRRSALNGQRSDSLLRRRVDRIAERGSERRQGGLSDSRGGLLTWNGIDLHRWRLIHPQRGVIVEVTLYDTAFVDRDLGAQCVRQAVYNATLNLLFENAWIDHLSAIYSGNHTMHSGLVLLHRDLYHLGHVSLETAETRDPAMMSGGKWLVPAGFLGGQLQYRTHPACVPRRREIWKILILGQQLQAIL